MAPDAMGPTLDSTFAISEGALFRDLDGEAVILDPEAGTYYGLNAVGTRIWRLIEQHGRLRPVFEQLCLEYDAAPDVLERDMLDLVRGLADAGLGRVHDSP
jgi:hypothetical protein